MTLIPIFKQMTTDELEDKFDLFFDSPEWVNIQFKTDNVKTLDANIEPNPDEDIQEYECNRYDAVYTDDQNEKELSVYIYMNEHSSQVIAIDSVVIDKDDENATYRIQETPVGRILDVLIGR